MNHVISSFKKFSIILMVLFIFFPCFVYADAKENSAHTTAIHLVPSYKFVNNNDGVYAKGSFIVDTPTLEDTLLNTVELFCNEHTKSCVTSTAWVSPTTNNLMVYGWEYKTLKWTDQEIEATSENALANNSTILYIGRADKTITLTTVPKSKDELPAKSHLDSGEKAEEIYYRKHKQ